jgi:DNA-damage-inducible protein D
MDKKLIVFEHKNIRRIWHNDEWYYSIVDVIEALTESPNPRQYWGKLKEREFENLQLSPIWVRLKLKASDEKFRLTDCSNTKGIFRIIQSIPSKRAEPFKLWLAQLGQERIEEIEDPELAQNRAKEYYELKGYPKEWIDKRIRGIAIRQDLTDEWKKRGVAEKKDYAILTNEIHKATFDISIHEHKDVKEIPKQSKINLRDHMTDLELIFTMLGERATTEITQVQDARAFTELQDASQKGGNIAKIARVELEKQTGKKVVSKENHLNLETQKNIE